MRGGRVPQSAATSDSSRHFNRSSKNPAVRPIGQASVAKQPYSLRQSGALLNLRRQDDRHTSEHIIFHHRFRSSGNLPEPGNRPRTGLNLAGRYGEFISGPRQIVVRQRRTQARDGRFRFGHRIRSELRPRAFQPGRSATRDQRFRGRDQRLFQGD